jgi:hypothetical protein
VTYKEKSYRHAIDAAHFKYGGGGLRPARSPTRWQQR